MGKEIINRPTIFNSALEIGLRSLVILLAAFPNTLDLHRLLLYDYLVLHSGDVGGPESIHPPLPLRTGELLVRRGLIESGLLLMMSRNLVSRVVVKEGFYFKATDNAFPYVEMLSATYTVKIKNRAVWVAEKFSDASDDDLKAVMTKVFDRWTIEFQPHEF